MQLKYIEDYYDAIKERFPDLEISEIERILKHGFRSFYTVNNHGADVIIKSPKLFGFTMYFGKLFNNKQYTSLYSTIKYRIKYRIQYKRKKPIWDGYYYFGLTEEENEKYIPKKKGRFKNKIVFEELSLYKIVDEVFLTKRYKYFYKIKMDKDSGFFLKEKNLATRNIELIAIRDKENKIQMI